jgi:hypothetical protein
MILVPPPLKEKLWISKIYIRQLTLTLGVLYLCLRSVCRSQNPVLFLSYMVYHLAGCLKWNTTTQTSNWTRIWFIYRIKYINIDVAYQIRTLELADHCRTEIRTIEVVDHFRTSDTYSGSGGSLQDIRYVPSNWPGYVTRLTQRMPLVEQGLPTLPEHLSSFPVFSVVRVARSLVLCVMFCRSLLAFCSLSIVLSVFLRFRNPSCYSCHNPVIF